MKSKTTTQQPVHSEDMAWGNHAPDHYGYTSDTERLQRRGLEDWEMVECIAPGQKHVPMWFIAGVIVIIIAAIALSLPFLGDRPGQSRPWLTMGHLYALLYVGGSFVLVYFMTRLYGSGNNGDAHADFEDDVDMPRHVNKQPQPHKKTVTTP
ncbi:MAG: hypothetical protein COS35_11640 [Zetaproteobacteria bacterium CG02_land_8_20_14_3_00_50_9]|nr:MAG: hypothetical protein COW62_01000 [Zetaproteobacteria bacterium CG17_big_fil_post_rev_8_21_14_2_50_50_13]PIV29528.1 MAG: hypothetical protein COS35_11640 [Zetaproteobacteria bacterium CG02_land_8_20_14_3_00_50_9]PIY55733.1 MAG: hypothetical protein COZ00_07975 [Zetaproteobacteria bacterium CG_4_10_14_0_8_um_filter_49_80]